MCIINQIFLMVLQSPQDGHITKGDITDITGTNTWAVHSSMVNTRKTEWGSTAVEHPHHSAGQGMALGRRLSTQLIVAQRYYMTYLSVVGTAYA